MKRCLRMIRKCGSLLLIAMLLLTLAHGEVQAAGKKQTGWVEKNGRTYYYNKKGQKVTGLKKIGDARYYFSPTYGVRKTGWRTIKGSRYYFSPKTGKMLTGWRKIRGKWYFFKKTGKMCSDTWVKRNGRYVYISKDGTLFDDQTAARIAKPMKKDLKAAFTYAGGISFYGRTLFDETWSVKKLAAYGFANRQGNCYVYSAVFCQVARAMGYDAHQVTGYVQITTGWGPHSWVEIDMDGETYVFEPDGLRILGMDHTYMFHYGDKGTWKYADYVRMN